MPWLDQRAILSLPASGSACATRWLAVEVSDGKTGLRNTQGCEKAPRTSTPSINFSKGIGMSSFNIVGQGEVEIGASCQIGADTQIVFSKPGKVRLGDYCS